MAETAKSFPVLREAVASFADRAHFRRAVSSLLAAGFRHEDVSVLASHQPLAAAEGEPGEFVAAGLSDELNSSPRWPAPASWWAPAGPFAWPGPGPSAAGPAGPGPKELSDDSPRSPPGTA